MRICRCGGMVYASDSKSDAFAGLWVRVPPPAPLNKNQRGSNMELKKMLIENRISLLRSRDPVGNAKIIRKNERILRKLNNQK